MSSTSLASSTSSATGYLRPLSVYSFEIPKNERNSFGSIVALITLKRFPAWAFSFLASERHSSSCEDIWWLSSK